ncbi:hypothetical protein R5W24_003534 [Gemmata sp. JC717]|uniref:hypothetical protein n=1 Tax=Gemmata algarum TaxID=2975278 RepID=UPI0021BB930B|nr:hypothetical protein [Gemmata algarum]MDY3554412.1 hypothetical protein [Gemmata algarum]
MSLDRSEHAGSDPDPFSGLGAGVTPARHRGPQRSGERTALAGVLLALGAVLMIGAAITAHVLRTRLIEAELSEELGLGVAWEFRAEHEREVRNWQLGLAGCAAAFVAGGLVCRAAYRVYDAGSPVYRGRD